MTGNPNGRPRKRIETNYEAANTTIRTLEAAGRIEPGDAALVTYVLTTARAVDEAPTHANLRMEYRAALQELRRLHERDAGSLEELVAGMRAEMGDAETRPTIVGARGGGDRDQVGVAVHAVATPGRRRRPGTAA